MRLFTATVLLTLVLPAAPAGAGRAAGGFETVSRGNDSTIEKGADKPGPKRVPALRVTKRVRGLSTPWDVKSIGNGRLLVTERDTGRLIKVGKGGKRQVKFPSDNVWVAGETGLMSLEIDRRFDQNRRFYTCQGWESGGGHDIRVLAWTLNGRATRATLADTLVKGFPTTSGRHGGCRLLITRNGALVVGTGDAAVGTNPRDLRSLGGKTLRLDPQTGAPWPGNPFIGSDSRKTRYVLTYGHRNVQGLAQRPDGSIWSVEHGSFRDDEVNRLVPGGDYGWHPVPGYNESVPMTDFGLPGKQYGAKWRSGDPTLATSGGLFVIGKQWGALNGSLAVAALKAERVVFLTFNKFGKLVRQRAPAALRTFGRLRSISRADNGDLFITTDTDAGGSVLRVSPAG